MSTPIKGCLLLARASLLRTPRHPTPTADDGAAERRPPRGRGPLRAPARPPSRPRAAWARPSASLQCPPDSARRGAPWPGGPSHGGGGVAAQGAEGPGCRGLGQVCGPEPGFHSCGFGRVLTQMTALRAPALAGFSPRGGGGSIGHGVWQGPCGHRAGGRLRAPGLTGHGMRARGRGGAGGSPALALVLPQGAWAPRPPLRNLLAPWSAHGWATGACRPLLPILPRSSQVRVSRLWPPPPRHPRLCRVPAQHGHTQPG